MTGRVRLAARYIAATGLGRARRHRAHRCAHDIPTLVAEHAAAGRPIDDSMVVAIGGVMHYGAGATRKLAEIGRPATPARRFLLWFVGRGAMGGARSTRRWRLDGAGSGLRIAR